MALKDGSSGKESIKNRFLVPDYFKKFTCKGSECRNCCCSGWGITIPMQQYFTLVGLPGTKKLREKIDRAFCPLSNPTPERYAEISHNYRGDCPLHMENGYCAIQYHFGEDVLPSVCRYYPRGPRTDYAMECSCANSCEKTLELLFENDDLITFETKELEFRMPCGEHNLTVEDQAFYVRVRAFCFGILEKRSFSLPTRMLMIGKVLSALDADRQVDLLSIDLTVPSYAKDIPFTYDVLFNISRWFIENSRSISDDCSENEAFYRDGNWLEKYESTLKHFDQILPNQEILFEKMLINNLFFRQFPFQAFSGTLTDAFISLCGTYLFIRYLSICLMRDRNGLEDFIDLMAKTFRVITHTSFERNIMILLKNENAADLESLGKLIQA
jgi:hypothetical protein